MEVLLKGGVRGWGIDGGGEWGGRGGGIWVFEFILGDRAVSGSSALVASALQRAEETQTAADYGSLGPKTRHNEAFCSLSSA